MNGKDEKKGRRALTILVTAGIVLVMLIATLIAFLVSAYFISKNVIPDKLPNLPIFPRQMAALTFMLLINVGVGVVIALFLSKKALIYVNRIINRMNRLASGDYSARLSYGKPISMHPTIQEITKSFNQMAEELEKTEMLRMDFINNLSHEFKTPIVSIAGFARILKKGNLSKEQQTEYLTIIEEEAKRLSTLANNVLNMTKVENQTILTNTLKFNLSEQIRSCILLLEEKWSKKELEWGLDFGEYEIKADEKLLKEVWINLLDNAVKFSPIGEKIVIQIKEKEDYYQIIISNPGREFPEGIKEKLFHKFYQADESRSGEGNGIGLAIVKRVVELHKGRVFAECGGGMVSFIVELKKICLN